jgi:hypothetical protein
VIAGLGLGRPDEHAAADRALLIPLVTVVTSLMPLAVVFLGDTRGFAPLGAVDVVQAAPEKGVRHQAGGRDKGEESMQGLAPSGETLPLVC